MSFIDFFVYHVGKNNAILFVMFAQVIVFRCTGFGYSNSESYAVWHDIFKYRFTCYPGKEGK